MTKAVKKETLCDRYNKLFDMLKAQSKGEINKNDVLRLLYRECLVAEAIEDKGFVKMAEELADMHRNFNLFRKRIFTDSKTIDRLSEENEKFKDITWAQADEIDKLAAENYRLTNHVRALQERLYLNNINHNIEENNNA